MDRWRKGIILRIFLCGRKDKGGRERAEGARYLRGYVAESRAGDGLPVGAEVGLVVGDGLVAALLGGPRGLGLHELHRLLQVGAHLERTRPEAEAARSVGRSALGLPGQNRDVAASPAQVGVGGRDQEHDVAQGVVGVELVAVHVLSTHGQVGFTITPPPPKKKTCLRSVTE